MIVNESASPKLAVLQGGKGATNWLWHLPVSTVFLTRESGTLRFELVLFQVVEKSGENVRLMCPNYTGSPPQFIWVDPIKFSSQMERREILALGQEEDALGDNTE